MKDERKQPAAAPVWGAEKTDWERITVHVRKSLKRDLQRLLGGGGVSPWVNRLILAALPSLLREAACRERELAAAVAAADSISASAARGARRESVTHRGAAGGAESRQRA